MPQLFHSIKPTMNIQAAFFAMSSLMIILLPTLLMITNPEKLIGFPVELQGNGNDTVMHMENTIERIHLSIQRENAHDIFRISASIRKTDFLANAGDVEEKTWIANDWTESMEHLRSIHELDPTQHSISFAPAPENSTQDVVFWMDGLQKELEFSDIMLEYK